MNCGYWIQFLLCISIFLGRRLLPLFDQFLLLLPSLSAGHPPHGLAPPEGPCLLHRVRQVHVGGLRQEDGDGGAQEGAEAKDEEGEGRAGGSLGKR